MNRFFVRFFLGQVGDVLGELDVSVAAGDVEGVGGGRSGGGGRLAGRSSGRFAGRYVEIFPRVLSRRRRVSEDIIAIHCDRSPPDPAARAAAAAAAVGPKLFAPWSLSPLCALNLAASDLRLLRKVSPKMLAP